MDVPPAFACRKLLDAFAGLVEVAPIFDDLCAIGAHRGVLVGVVPDRDQNAALHTMEPAGEGNRLPMISGTGADHPAAPLVGHQLGHQVEATANLERAGGVVVLVLDPRLAAKPVIEKVM